MLLLGLEYYYKVKLSLAKYSQLGFLCATPHVRYNTSSSGPLRGSTGAAG